MFAFCNIRVTGCVQGVGFRPFIWQLAKQFEATGWVLNDSEGVLIDIKIHNVQLQRFVDEIKKNAPALASVETVAVTNIVSPQQIEKLNTVSGFDIVESKTGVMNTVVLPDAATCDLCRSEINDPKNRRYGYAFTNCTLCGPRYSIIKNMPYDRAQTSMADFEMCDACLAEYNNPADRRFHAQPNACPDCGPKLYLAKHGEIKENQNYQAWSFEDLDSDSMFDQACLFLKQGKILAVKGLGGYHLVCDAMNDKACNLLRERKYRPAKPFALMAADIESVGHYCDVGNSAKTWLSSVQSPIVLMPKLTKNTSPYSLSESIAPNQSKLGFMLPSNPLHILLMQKWQKESGHGVLVFTSANRSGMPQAYLQEHEKALLDLADHLLTHNRPIVRRLEDSVVLITPDDDFLVLRQSRGFSPFKVNLPKGFEVDTATISAGGDLKNSIAIRHHGQIILSHYLGDLANFDVQTAYKEALDDLTKLYQLRPEKIQTDLHPGYFSSGFMDDFSRNHGLKNNPVQHHHAHFNACMVENGIPDSGANYLGVILDGLGYGEENHFWGGEFLYGNYHAVNRVASLQAKPLLGGDKANKEPWRNLYAYLRDLKDFAGLDVLLNEYKSAQSLAKLKNKPIDLLEQMFKQSINSPMSSSAGRLFDAVSALCNICFEQVSYEGQAATEFEAYVSKEGVLKNKDLGYLCEIVSNSRESEQELNYLLSVGSIFKAVLVDIEQGVLLEDIACRFHIGFANGIVSMISKLKNEYDFDSVVFSGGVCQNSWLIYLIEHAMPKEIAVLKHRMLPANDQSIAIGQAVK
ncbi:Carbamoyltransferase HypF [Hydrogenovibrio crunogenus]|uniref:Carbamoyltransferase HypF n=1 Tax=Hydrogenovibrio crunogenus TaxID=39765 RepID=A0A4P7NYV1_9GAMM|nr:carbamoyltransferase HypF [Hydrogenovibrio crunogenus]QBZ82759.1 Carbamoyltransferase HypF [Hydrogenovibrio crunogenus]